MIQTEKNAYSFSDSEFPEFPFFLKVIEITFQKSYNYSAVCYLSLESLINPENSSAQPRKSVKSISN